MESRLYWVLVLVGPGSGAAASPGACLDAPASLPTPKHATDTDPALPRTPREVPTSRLQGRLRALDVKGESVHAGSGEYLGAGEVVPTQYTPPRYPAGMPPPPGRVRTRTGTPRDTARTCTFGVDQGDPRGGKRTATLGTLDQPHARLTHGPQSPSWGLLLGHAAGCWSGSQSGLRHLSGISQVYLRYISGKLSQTQLYLR